MSKKLRFASLVMAGLFSLSALTACSATESSSTSSTDSESSSEESSEEEVVDTNMDGDVQLSEPGEFPIVIGDPVELSVFTAYNASQCTEFDSSVNAATAFIEEQDNVHFTWTIVSSADKTAKLNLLFQSNSYEDIIFGTQWDSATQYSYGTQGYLVDISSYVEDYSYYYQEYIDGMIEDGYNTQTHWDSLTMPNGAVYSMANGNGSSHTSYTTRMWVYEPWLDTLGLEIPTTTDEFYDMLVAMRDGDPNGNGVADEIPLAGSPSGWKTDPFDFLANSFVYYNADDYTYVEDGEIQLAYLQDEFKDALIYYNSLVEDNLMMTDTFTQDSDSLKLLTTADLDERIVGVAPGGMQATIANMVNYEDGEWTDWVSIAPLEGPDGVQYALQNSIYPTAMGHITDNCEYPIVAFRVMDSFYETTTGLTIYAGSEGEFWDYVEPGTYEGEKGGDATFTRYSQGENGETNYCWATIGPYSIGPDSEWPVQGEADYNQGVLLYRAAAEHAEYAPDSDMVMPPLIYDEEDSSDVVDYKTAISTYLEEAIVTFAMYGGIEEGWDAFLEKMDALGTQELLVLYQEAYDTRMAAMEE